LASSYLNLNQNQWRDYKNEKNAQETG
jgi:hypothetical protein